MPQIGPLEIVMILVVALVVFGPKKLPEVGKQAARGLREFRRFQSGVRGDLQHMLDEDDEHPVPSPNRTERTAVDRAADDEVAEESVEADPVAPETPGPPPDGDARPGDTTP